MFRFLIGLAVLVALCAPAVASQTETTCTDAGPVRIDFGSWALVVEDKDACPEKTKSAVVPPVETERCLARRVDHFTVAMRKVDGKWIEEKKQTCLIYEK